MTNKFMLESILILLTSFFLFSCKSKVKNHCSDLVIDRFGQDVNIISSEILDVSSFKNILEQKDDNKIGNIVRVTFEGAHFSNGSCVCLYDANEEFISTLEEL